MSKTLTAEQLLEHVDKEFKDFSGIFTEFESAVGAFIVGRKVGWKVLLLVHDRRTIAKYEKLLGLSFREHLPDEGVWAHKSIAWNVVKKAGQFWKVVRGEIANIRTPELKKA